MKKAYNKAEITSVDKLCVNDMCAQCAVSILAAVGQWANFENGGGMSTYQYDTYELAYLDNLYDNYGQPNQSYNVNYYQPENNYDDRDRLKGSIVRTYRFYNYQGYYMVYEDYYPYMDPGDSALIETSVGVEVPPSARGDNWQYVNMQQFVPGSDSSHWIVDHNPGTPVKS